MCRPTLARPSRPVRLPPGPRAHVAYETLSKKERRTRHLAAAAYLEGSFANEDEVAEVLASHYLAAYTALPEAEDAAEIKRKAQEALVRAGDRAESLGAAGESRRYFERAAELTDDASAAGRSSRSRRLAWAGSTAEWSTPSRTPRRCHRPVRGRGRSPLGRTRVRAARGRSRGPKGEWKTPSPAPRRHSERSRRTSRARSSLCWQAVSRRATSSSASSTRHCPKPTWQSSFPSPSAPRTHSRGAFTSMALAALGTRPEQSTALLKQSLAIAREHDLYDCGVHRPLQPLRSLLPA